MSTTVFDPPDPTSCVESAPPVAQTPHRNKIVRLLVAAALLAGAVLLDPSAWLAVPVLFLLVVPFEKLFPRHRQRLRRPGLMTDMCYAATQPILAVGSIAAAVVVGALSLAWLPGLALRPLIDMIPGTPRLIAGILLFDFLAYWTHRWSHEVPFMWRFHAIHHSTKRLDWISGFRAHPFDGVLVAPAFFFVIAAGFDPQFAGVLAIIQIVSGLFVHANVRWRVRPLHKVVITPEFHHWHHSNEREAHCSNYSIFLPLWDLLFGTYFMPRDRRPMVYGVSERVPDGIVAQLTHPLRGLHGPRFVLRHPLRQLRHLVRSLRRGVRQIVASTRRPTRRSAHRPVRP
jgi:sterol desaturase/sphingolipid hydroxylase (fatty acid hydroxylase superfamily)